MNNPASTAAAEGIESERASLLNVGFDFDDQLLEMILYRVETNIRNICYAMQMVDHHGFEPDEFEKLSSMFGTFYEFVDGQMDTITRLRGELDRDFSWLSLNKLRQSDDFRRKPLPREAFVSDERYREHLAQFAARQQPKGRRDDA